MASYFEQYQKRRLITSYISVLVVITLVLFISGAFGLVMLNINKITDHFKENLTVSFFLKESVKDNDIKALEKSFLSKKYTKSIKFVSKEEAAKLHSKALGDDFISFLGYNPLKDSFDLNLKSEYVDSQTIDVIINSLKNDSRIYEIVYNDSLINILEENSKLISYWIFGITIFFVVIAVLLINSSIRLTIYSRRFIIKTMQMVGAKKGFIRKPFIYRSIRWGIFSSIVACGLIILGLYYLETYYTQLNLLADKNMLAKLFFGVFTLGILIPWITTFFAAQQFLNLNTDQLYD